MSRLKAVVFGSILLNVLVWAFALPPRRLMMALVVHAAVVFALFYAAGRTHSDAVEITAYVWLLFGPTLVAAAEHIRHEVLLDRKPESEIYAQTPQV
jgi:hypothetical protein